MKQIYDLCALCSLYEQKKCQKGHRLHPLKATAECDDFQFFLLMLFEECYKKGQEDADSN